MKLEIEKYKTKNLFFWEILKTNKTLDPSKKWEEQRDGSALAVFLKDPDSILSI